MINIDYIIMAHGEDIILQRSRDRMTSQKMVIMPSFAFTNSIDTGDFALGDPSQQLYLILGGATLDIEIDDEFEYYPERANLNNVRVINVDRAYKRFSHIQALGRVLT